MRYLAFLFGFLLFVFPAYSATNNVQTTFVPASGGDTISHIVTESDSSGNASVNVPAPTGVLDGDRMVLCVAVDSASATLDTPSGWTLEESGTAGGNIIARCFYKDASSESGTYDFTTGSTSGTTYSVTVFRKTGGTWDTPTSNSTDETTGATMTTDSLSSVAGGIMYSSWFNDGAGTVTTPPSGPTAPTDNYTAASSSAQAVYYEATSTAAGYSKSITWSANEQMNAIQITVSLQ